MSPRRAEGRRRIWGPPWTWWRIAGIVLAGLVAVGGLTVLGFFIVAYVGLSQFASNK